MGRHDEARPRKEHQHHKADWQSDEGDFSNAFASCQRKPGESPRWGSEASNARKTETRTAKAPKTVRREDTRQNDAARPPGWKREEQVGLLSSPLLPSLVPPLLPSPLLPLLLPHPQRTCLELNPKFLAVLIIDFQPSEARLLD